MRIWLALVGVLFLAAAGCGSSSSGSSNSSSEAAASEVETLTDAEPATTEVSTEAPEPTAVPEPTEEPTPEPEPTPSPTEAPEPTPEPTEVPEADTADAADNAAAVAAVDCPTDAEAGNETYEIESGGNTYSYLLQIPETYDGTTVPLVLNFHGLGSNGGEQAGFSGYPALANREGFALVHPTGQLDPEDRNSWELSLFETDERDDVQFVRDMLDEVAGLVCYDPARVYSTGMSNGALFSSELICQLGDRIAAAASIAGVTHSATCEPTRAVPYIAFHGTDDAVVPFNGGGESTLGAGEFFEQVMPDEFGEFATDFNCAEPVAVELTAEATRFDYEGCDDDVELSFYAIEGHGHNWPGSLVGKALEAGLGANNMDVDATALSWEFFQRHSLN